MNEETKDIETCLPDNILSEVASVPTDSQFRSLVDEALDPLKQQALRQVGYDGYKEVVMYHQPYTFTSQVKQMKSNLILLLRRLWSYPFGRGTTASSAAGSVSAGSAAGSSAAAPIRSLADMWQHYINRLKGNAEYGIPSSLSQLTDLPDAPALLADRDMSSGIRFGEPPLPDGMSLAQLLCSTSADKVTELQDSNKGWVMTKQFPANTYFPNCKKMELGCEDIDVTFNYNGGTVFGIDAEYHLPNLKVIHPETINVGFGHGVFDCAVQTHDIYMPELERIDGGSNFGIIRGQSAQNNTEPFSLYAPKLSIFGRGARLVRAYKACSTGLEKVVLGIIYSAFEFAHNVPTSTSGMATPNLVHFEFGQGTNASLNLAGWSPTNALDASKTDLIEEGSTAQNNLQQFLQNFKTYIAERLTDNGSGLTLTLSQEVRNAIHAAEDEYGIENIIITKKGWTISPAPN